MLPKVIIHNSVSLDGSLTAFDVNLPLHYQIAGSFNADMHLVGSNTAKTGIDLFIGEPPKETEEDWNKPDKEGILWAIPDSTGKLKGLLHVFRQSEHCQDVVIFVAETTPRDYLNYLRDRDYDYHVLGENTCDLQRVLACLTERYTVKTLLTDTGRILSNLLLEQGLVSHISMLVHPIIVGTNAYTMFGNIHQSLKLHLIREEVVEHNHLWLVYEVEECMLAC